MKQAAIILVLLLTITTQAQAQSLSADYLPKQSAYVPQMTEKNSEVGAILRGLTPRAPELQYRGHNGRSLLAADLHCRFQAEQMVAEAIINGKNQSIQRQIAQAIHHNCMLAEGYQRRPVR